MIEPVIFLDIDGPIITSDLAAADYRISYQRLGCNRGCINQLVDLASRTSARIVTNTMHNAMVVKQRTIRDDLVSWGVPHGMFHHDWKTIFPRVDYTNAGPRRGIGRLIAIKDWLSRNGDRRWVCFDDRSFTDDPRLILVDPLVGIGPAEKEAALKLLGETVS